MSEVISHEGIAEQVTGDNVRVRIVQGSACSGCSARAACHAAETGVKYIEGIAPSGSVCSGDRVVVEVAKHLGWKAVLLAFILPFLLLIITLFVLIHCGLSEVQSGLIALSSLLPYYLVIYLCRNRFQAEYRFNVRPLDK